MPELEVDFELQPLPEIEADFEIYATNDDHNLLINRDLADQHPISAITGLETALDGKQDTLTAGDNIQIEDGVISATDTTYTAGDGISIENGVISNTQTSAEWGNITGTLSDQTDLQNALGDLSGGIDSNHQAISNHVSDKNNPHEVTKAQVGLGNVDNTSDLNKPISTATQTALNGKADKSTTLAGYGITNAYTKTEVDNALSGKQNNLDTTQMAAVNSGANTTNIGQIATNTNSISSINELIPNEASSSNQLADKEFVNSSISTNTARFIGTFSSVTALESYSGTVTNNDYAFVTNSVITDNGNDWATFAALDAYNKDLLTNFDYGWVINGSKFDLYRFDIVNQEWVSRATNIHKADVTLNSAYNRYKATVTSGTATWEYEYTLNNSSFTASQWAAINSGITSGDVALIETALQPNDNISGLYNDSGYLVSSDITTGATNGTIAVNGTDVAVYGLGSAAYTASTAYDASGSASTAETNAKNYADSLASNYATAAQGALADTALQPADLTGYATESWVGNQGYITGITSSDVTFALGYTPYNSSNPSGYQANVIETVKVNGTSLTPTNKAVDITVPSAVTESTVSGWGFTKNVGTVTSVNNTQPDANGNVTISTGGNYTAGTGIDITNDVISVASPTLTNTATGTNSLTILGYATSKQGCVNIGIRSATNNSTFATAVGSNASVGNNAGSSVAIGSSSSVTTDAQNATAVGGSSNCRANRAIALGSNASARGDFSIQLGFGTNSEANSFYVATSSSHNWKMLGSDGKIPSGRLPIATSVSLSSTNSETVGAKLFYDTCGDIESLINAL